MLKILGLDVTNFKRIKAVEIDTQGDHIVYVSGVNEQGKSSTLDAIKTAIEGPKGRPGLIRNGEDKSVIDLDLGKFTISRVLTADGKTSLRIENESGAKVNSPAKFLKELSGGAIIDISDFILGKNAESKKNRIKAIADICDIDYDQISKNRKEVFEERTSVNRELKRKQNSLQEMIDTYGSIHREKVEDERDSSTLAKELSDINSAHLHLNALEENLKATKNSIHQIEEAIKDYQNRLEEAKKKEKDYQDKLKEHKEKVSKHRKKEEVEKELQEIKSNSEIRNNALKMKELAKETKALKKESEALTERIQDIDTELRDKISAKINIEGLVLEEDNLIFNDALFEECSSSRKIKIAMSIIMAKNPELRVALITDGSLLDKNSLDTLRKLAEENDFQVWVEIVDSSGDFPIVIENGEFYGKHTMENISNQSDNTRKELSNETKSKENISTKETETNEFDSFSVF